MEGKHPTPLPLGKMDEIIQLPRLTIMFEKSKTVEQNFANWLTQRHQQLALKHNKTRIFWNHQTIMLIS